MTLLLVSAGPVDLWTVRRDRFSDAAGTRRASSVDSHLGGRRKLVAARRRAAEDHFGLGNRSRATRGLGPDRHRHSAVEKQVALDEQPERKPQRGDLVEAERPEFGVAEAEVGEAEQRVVVGVQLGRQPCRRRSEEHTSELQSLMRISYAVCCLTTK